MLPHRFKSIPLEADPVSKHDNDFYRNHEKRGYLAGMPRPTLLNWPYKIPTDDETAAALASRFRSEGEAPEHRWGFRQNATVDENVNTK